jgi:hypothetical protein
MYQCIHFSPDISSPDDSFSGRFFARTILRQICFFKRIFYQELSVNILPSKNCPGERFSEIVRLTSKFFWVKIYPLMNCTSAKESGGELSERKIVQRKNHPAKYCPAKNCPVEELSVEELSVEELSVEELSVEELSVRKIVQ